VELENIRKALLADLGSIAEYYGPKGDAPFDPFTSEERMKQMISVDDLVVAEVDGSFADLSIFLWIVIHGSSQKLRDMGIYWRFMSKENIRA